MNYKNPLLTTDIIITYENKGRDGLILISRKNPPYGLALPGGFAEYGLTLKENAIKEAKEETGLNVLILDGDKPFLVRSDPERDPRNHIVTVVYVAEGRGTLMAGDDASTAGLYTFREIENLLGHNKFAFDHEYIIREYLRTRRDP
jgi:ADP-ribose pyrophosphatase YjhB (NUDIX family)